MPTNVTFIVLQEVGSCVWEEIPIPSATSREEAIALAYGDKPPEERVVVVSTQAFRPGRVKPKQVLSLELET